MNTESHSRRLKIGCCIQVSDAQMIHHLRPLADHPLINEIHIIRNSLPTSLNQIQKFNHHTVSKFPLTFRLQQMYFTCRRLLNEGQTAVFLSFNSIPYGIISRGHNSIPIHFGFIGNGWKQRLIRSLLKSIFHKAALITVPGGDERKHDVGVDFPKANYGPPTFN